MPTSLTTEEQINKCFKQSLAEVRGGGAEGSEGAVVVGFEDVAVGLQVGVERGAEQAVAGVGERGVEPAEGLP
jgi:hypothetical protein